MICRLLAFTTLAVSLCHAANVPTQAKRMRIRSAYDDAYKSPEYYSEDDKRLDNKGDETYSEDNDDYGYGKYSDSVKDYGYHSTRKNNYDEDEHKQPRWCKEYNEDERQKLNSYGHDFGDKCKNYCDEPSYEHHREMCDSWPYVIPSAQPTNLADDREIRRAEDMRTMTRSCSEAPSPQSNVQRLTRRYVEQQHKKHGYNKDYAKSESYEDSQTGCRVGGYCKRPDWCDQYDDSERNRLNGYGDNFGEKCRKYCDDPSYQNRYEVCRTIPTTLPDVSLTRDPRSFRRVRDDCIADPVVPVPVPVQPVPVQPVPVGTA